MTRCTEIATIGWLSGIARCLDLAGVYDEPREFIPDDEAALRSDWERVREDFRSVVG